MAEVSGWFVIVAMTAKPNSANINTPRYSKTITKSRKCRRKGSVVPDARLTSRKKNSNRNYTLAD